MPSLSILSCLSFKTSRERKSETIKVKLPRSMALAAYFTIQDKDAFCAKRTSRTCKLHVIFLTQGKLSRTDSNSFATFRICLRPLRSSAKILIDSMTCTTAINYTYNITSFIQPCNSAPAFILNVHARMYKDKCLK